MAIRGNGSRLMSEEQASSLPVAPFQVNKDCSEQPVQGPEVRHSNTACAPLCNGRRKCQIGIISIRVAVVL